MKKIQGDLLNLALAGKFDVIVHGCNCQCTMGAGIANSIKTLFPKAYKADCQTKKGDREKLGTNSQASVVRGGIMLTIVNAYTQFHWRGTGVKADYDAIRSAMQVIKREHSGQRIGYPLIGAGLAGGDWSVIEEIITSELAGEDHTLVEYRP